MADNEMTLNTANILKGLLTTIQIVSIAVASWLFLEVLDLRSRVILLESDQEKVQKIDQRLQTLDNKVDDNKIILIELKTKINHLAKEQQ